MIDGLIAGKVQGQPMRKTGKTGKAFVTAKVRAHAGDGDVFVNVISFSDSTGAALLALGDGEAVALAGTLKPGAWLDKEGNARPTGEKPTHDAWKAHQLKPDHTGLDDGEPLDF